VGAPPADSELRALIEARVTERRRSRHRSAPVRADAVHATAVLTHDEAPKPLTRSESRRAAEQLRRQQRRAAPSALKLVLLVAATLLGVVVLRTFVIASFYIPSGSMEPTLHGCPGCEPDMVVVDKLAYRFGHVSRSDVVVFNRPPLAPAEDKELVKRVIGMPGETVSAHGGKVYIGDRALSEPYINPSCHGTADFAPVTVGPGQYFMMGDNRCDSFDSRRFGAISQSAIVGRAFAIIWPMKHVRWL
jgi:signal peptidase I